jgi:hypothetical protein
VLVPKQLGPAIDRLRGSSLLLFDRLSDEQFDQEALPGWTVADVFRHLADSDRRSTLGTHLLEFLPGKDLDEFEQHNDANLARLRAVDRQHLRRELQVWGRRLARVVRYAPTPLARLRVPTAFGRLPVGWVAALRLYDEWVHQWDVAQAIGDPVPPMDVPLRGLLAEFQLLGLAATAPAGSGCVEVQVTGGPTWRYDLASRRAGADVAVPPTATVALDVVSFCLVAAARRPWRELAADGDVRVADDRAGSAATLLDACRVV